MNFKQILFQLMAHLVEKLWHTQVVHEGGRVTPDEAILWALEKRSRLDLPLLKENAGFVKQRKIKWIGNILYANF